MLFRSIQKLKAFRAERLQIELASNEDGHVQEETRQLFMGRFSQGLIKLCDNLPNFLAAEGRVIRDSAEAPLGGGARALDLPIETLESVSASL